MFLFSQSCTFACHQPLRASNASWSPTTISDMFCLLRSAAAITLIYPDRTLPTISVVFFFFGNLGNKFWKPRLPSFFLPVAQPCRVFTRVRTRSAAQKVINISRTTRGNRFPPLMKTSTVLINHYVSIWTWKSGPDVLAARTKLCLPPHPTSGWEGGIWEPRPQKRVNYKNMLLRGAFKKAWNMTKHLAAAQDAALTQC